MWRPHDCAMVKGRRLAFLLSLPLLLAGFLVLLLRDGPKEEVLRVALPSQSEGGELVAPPTPPHVPPRLPSNESSQVRGSTLLLLVIDDATDEVIDGAKVTEFGSKAELESWGVGEGWTRVRVPWAGPGDTCSLVVAARDYVPRLETVTLPETGACDFTSRLVRYADIEGVVIAANTGEPLSAVHVELEASVTGLLGLVGEEGKMAKLGQVSDADGGFAFRDLNPNSSYTLTFLATGYVQLEKRFESMAPGLNKLEVSLAPAFAITLNFTWTDGQPVKDASVELQWQPAASFFSPEGVKRTDANGTVTFEGVVGGKKWAHIVSGVEGEVFANVFEFVVGESEVIYSFECSASPECLVSVRYGDTGAPAGGCRVRLTLLEAPGSAIVRGVTNEEGTCCFRGARPGRAYIVLSPVSGEYATLNDWRAIIGAKGTTAKDYALVKKTERDTPSAMLRIDASALSGASQASDHCTLFLFRDDFLVKDCTFQISETLEIEKLRPGQYRVEAMSSDAWYASETLRIGAGARGTVTLSPVERRTLSGYVVDEEGRPFFRAKVSRTATRKGILGVPEILTDGSGFFSFEIPWVEPVGFLHVAYTEEGKTAGVVKVVPLSSFENGSRVVLERLR